MEYHKLSLEDREIRLLILEEGSNSAMVACRLEYVSLFNPPIYTALSYTWGNPDITKTILVNGVKVQATVSLEAGLRQLHAAGYIRIWADALCINQADREERSQQVNIMRIIYSRASDVVVWLGVETEESKIAMDYIKYQFSNDVRQLSTLDKSSKTKKQPAALITLDNRVSLALQSLFNRPYWKRVWILQEVVAAARVTVYCGTTCTNMESIEGVLDKTVTGEKLTQSGHTLNFNLFRKDPKTDMPRPLLALLLSSRSSLATDPRDKVYALLGLSSDGQELIPLPDYKNTLESIYLHICLSLLKLKECLGIITLRCGVEKEGRTRSLPSWVPEWGSLSSAARPWHRWLVHPDPPKLKFLSANGVHLPFEYLPFKLPPRTQSSCYENGYLRLKGIIIDTIDGISIRFGHSKTVCSLACSDHSMRQPYSKKSAYESDEKTVLAIASSLCFASIDFDNFDKGNVLDITSKAPNTESYLRYFNQLNTTRGREHLREACPDLPRWIADNKLFEIAGRSLRSWIKEPVETVPTTNTIVDILFSKFTEEMMAKAAGFDESLHARRFVHKFSQVVSHGMRLIVTSQGWVGMAHPQAQPGDLICTVLGCAMPLILRKSTHGYQVVGEGYLHPITKFGIAEKADGSLVDILLE